MNARAERYRVLNEAFQSEPSLIHQLGHMMPDGLPPTPYTSDRESRFMETEFFETLIYRHSKRSPLGRFSFEIRDPASLFPSARMVDGGLRNEAYAQARIAKCLASLSRAYRQWMALSNLASEERLDNRWEVAVARVILASAISYRRHDDRLEQLEEVALGYIHKVAIDPVAGSVENKRRLKQFLASILRRSMQGGDVADKEARWRLAHSAAANVLTVAKRYGGPSGLFGDLLANCPPDPCTEANASAIAGMFEKAFRDLPRAPHALESALNATSMDLGRQILVQLGYPPKRVKSVFSALVKREKKKARRDAPMSAARRPSASSGDNQTELEDVCEDRPFELDMDYFEPLLSQPPLR